jgi:superfamily II DNA or RNA helicase
VSYTSYLRLSFRDGVLCLEGAAGPLAAEEHVGRHPLGNFIAPAYKYAHLLKRSRELGVAVEDHAAKFLTTASLTYTEALDPFDFQKEAIEAWEHNQRRGIVVLPTGAGKSFMTRLLIAQLAIQDAACSALIIVPTRALLYQWHAQMHAAFGEDIGMIGDDEFDVRPITVTTYASARMHMNHIGNRWKLAVFDEVHRKMSQGPSSKAARFCLAPYRLGLTATPRAGEATLLTELIGPIVFEKTTEEMIEREILSVFDRKLVRLAPTAAEVAEFHRIKEPMDKVWKRAKEAHRVQEGAWLVRERMYHPDDVALAQRSQLQALRYWQSVPSRMARLAGILQQHPNDRVLIFTESRHAAFEISRRFLIPAVTADITAEERSFYLTAFARGRCRALVTAKALEEGIDLPDANVAIILAGGRRVKSDPISYIQRRGRILRKRKGKRAVVYEISWSLPPSRKGSDGTDD